MAKTTNRAGQTIVITGASSGFGKGAAQQLAKEGANLVLAARRTALLEELAEECGPNALAVTADVSLEADVAKIVREALKRFGHIDVWINNAAVGAIGPFTDVPPEDIIRAVHINLLGTMYGSHFALRHFQERKAGILINVGSIAGKVPFPYYTPYSMTKFAVNGLSAALQQEMEIGGYDDIHVCTLHPWATDTPWFEHTANYTGHAAEMKPIDDPQMVVDDMIGLIDNPQKNVDVGGKSSAAAASRKVMPGIAEKMNAKQVQKVIREAPPAPPTTGSLYHPMQTGTEVSGGVRERMKQEKRS